MLLESLMQATTRRVVLLLCVALTSFADAPDVLRVAPDEAAAFVLIPNIQTATRGLAGFSAAADIQQLAQRDAAALLESQPFLLGASEGVDLEGPVALIDHPLIGEGVACRLRDAERWKRASGAAAEADGLFQVRAFADQRLAWIKDDLLLLSSSREFLEAAQKNTGVVLKRWTKFAEEAADHQVCFFAEVAPWRPYLQPGVFFARQSMKAGMLMSAGSSAQAATDLWDSIFDNVAEGIDAAQVVYGGLDFSESGVSSRVAVVFAEDSSAARYLKNVQPAERPLLRGVPGGDPFFLLASEWKLREGQPNIYAHLSRAMICSTALRERIGGEKFDEALKLMESTISSISGYNTCIIALPRGEMLILGHNLTEKPKEIIASIEKAYQISPEFVHAYITGLQGGSQMETMQLNATQVHAFSLQFDAADAQMRMAFQQIYGEKPGFFLAPSKHGMLYGIGPWEATRESIESTLKLPDSGQGQMLEDSRVTALLQHLEPDPQVLAIADLPRALGYMLTIARKMGAPAPAPPPPSGPTPYAGVSMYLSPRRIRMSLFVPAEAARQLSIAFQAMDESQQPARKSKKSP